MWQFFVSILDSCIITLVHQVELLLPVSASSENVPPLTVYTEGITEVATEMI